MIMSPYILLRKGNHPNDLISGYTHVYSHHGDILTIQTHMFCGDDNDHQKSELDIT